MFEMCTSTIGHRNTLSASRIGIDVKLWPAGLITMPEADPDRLVDPVDQGRLAVGLPEFERHAERGCPFAAERLDVGQRGAAVDVRLAEAKQIQVGAVQDEDWLAHEALPSWALRPPLVAARVKAGGCATYHGPGF